MELIRHEESHGFNPNHSLDLDILIKFIILTVFNSFTMIAISAKKKEIMRRFRIKIVSLHSINK